MPRIATRRYTPAINMHYLTYKNVLTIAVKATHNECINSQINYVLRQRFNSTREKNHMTQDGGVATIFPILFCVDFGKFSPE